MATRIKPPSQVQAASPPTTVRRLKMAELGQTGLSRWGGYIDEEFLPQLKGRRAVRVFREMRDNDAVVGAVLFAVEMLLRKVTWRVEPGGPTYEDEAAAEFVEQCMHDMSHSWEDMISEILTMLTFGWAWHEIVYKRRLGNSRNPMFRSQFKDGRIAWRKMPIRSQDTLQEWDFDDDGGIDGMYQLAPPDWTRTYVPLSKSLLFRTTSNKNNPEGRSILRNAYRSWYFLKRLQEIEGIGIERDLAGLPLGRIPSEYLEALHAEDPDETKLAIAKAWRDMVRDVKRDEQEGLLIPSDVDEDTNEKLFDFELLSTGGQRQIDVDKPITRYEQRIAMTILADFILLGHEKVGSYALSTSKTGMFRAALNAWARGIAAVFNRHELPRLFELNGWKLKNLPEIIPGEVEAPPLEELGAFIKSLSGAGLQLFPDEQLENHLRQVADLPEKTEEAAMEQEVERRKNPLAMLAQGNGKTPEEKQALAELGTTGAEEEVSGNGKVPEQLKPFTL